MLVSAITYVFVCLAVPLVWFWLSRTFMLVFFSPARFEAQMAGDRRKLPRSWRRLLGDEDAPAEPPLGDSDIGEIDNQAGG